MTAAEALAVPSSLTSHQLSSETMVLYMLESTQPTQVQLRENARYQPSWEVRKATILR